MSYKIADGPLAESRVAEFTAQNKDLSRFTGVGYLADSAVRFPTEDGAGTPFSGDHLGTHSHRETTPYGDPGDEVRRERIHHGTVNIWKMVAA